MVFSDFDVMKCSVVDTGIVAVPGDLMPLCFAQLAACLALGTGCEGAAGEWEEVGVCAAMADWGQLHDSTLELRQRLMEF